MINSMTAYGRAAGITPDGSREILVELKSVNSRYLDTNIKVSRAHGYLEDKVKTHLAASGISRGKMDIYVGINQILNPDNEVTLDPAYAAGYIAALRQLRDTFDLPDDISTMRVAQNREVFTTRRTEEDAEAVWAAVAPFLDGAIAEFRDMRRREGQAMGLDLQEKKTELAALTADIAARAAEFTATYRTKLETRLNAVLEERDIVLDAARIVNECAIFADKTAVDEELVRLNSHFAAFDEMMQSTQPVGRKLDFLLQEMNREVNTIGSKCQDPDAAAVVIEMKHVLEKMREQMQNVE
ncbi:MAG: YicC family protein [Oscillospiraceae bacterium]|nr:YicC family protein [Oscillospiraceae bacterium]